MATQIEYHKSKDGKYRPCGAKKKPCPLGTHLTRTQLTHLENAEAGRTATDALQEAQRAGINTAEPHWRLHLSKRTGKLTPVCLSQFDYRDYEPARIHPGTAFQTVDEARQAIASIEPGNPEGETATPTTTRTPTPARSNTGQVNHLPSRLQQRFTPTAQPGNNDAQQIRDRIQKAGVKYPLGWEEMGSSEKDLWEDRIIARLNRLETYNNPTAGQ